MNKEEIRRLALLAAAKVTLLVGPPGCHDDASREGARAPRTNELTASDAAPHAACAHTPHVGVTIPSPPSVATQPAAPAAAVASAAPPPSIDASAPPPVAEPTAAPSPPQPVVEPLSLSPAACEALLRVTDKKGSTGMDDLAWRTAWKCCEAPSARSKHSFCTPWGPPAPPEMPAIDTAPGEVA